MTGRDMAHPNHCYSPKSRGHKPTLSSVSNTFSDISCATDISEVSNNSEEDITMTEDCDEENRDSISLKSMPNSSESNPSNCDLDKGDCKELLDTDSQTNADSESALVMVTKDCKPGSHVINTGNLTSVRWRSASLGPESVIKLPVTEATEPSGGGEIVELEKTVLDPDSESCCKTENPETETNPIMEKTPARSKSLTLKSVPLAYGSFLESPTESAEKSSWKLEDVKSSHLYQSTTLRAAQEPAKPPDNYSEQDVTEEVVRAVRADTIALDIPVDDTKDVKIPREPLKTLLSGVFLLSGFLATTTSLALTHERVPDIAPLPDAVLDNIRYQKWGLDVSEILLMLSTLTAIMVVMLHSHRLVILRRIWLVLGILYYYRALTMFITVLPKADQTYLCHPKSDNMTTKIVFKRILTIISGGGLSINGKHVYCGDYIFSGHTMTLTLGYLVIKQYSPSRFLFLHWASFLTSLFGVVFLLLARGHYSIDVLLAYWVTTRLWWVYHIVASNNNLKHSGQHNYLENMCWWHAARFFEINITVPLPRRYSIPLPQILKKRLRCKKTSPEDSQSGKFRKLESVTQAQAK